jgi:hypothetical protein
MIHVLLIPISPAPAEKYNGSPAEADENKKITKTETDILCSENNCFKLYD